LDASSNSTPEWTKRYSDTAGREYKIAYAAATGLPYEQVYFNQQGQPWKRRDADGNFTLKTFDDQGQPEYEVKCIVPVATVYSGYGFTDYSDLDYYSFAGNLGSHFTATDSNGKSDRVSRTVRTTVSDGIKPD